MIKIEKITDNQKIDKLRCEYISNLEEPIDGFWETKVIGDSECYELKYDEKNVGHVTINADKVLVQFCVYKEYLIYEEEIFKFIIMNNFIESASVSTKEPSFLSLCLDYHKSLSIESHLFTDNRNIDCDFYDLKKLSFSFAEDKDLGIIKDRCGLPFEGYYEELINNDQLFVLHDANTFLGIGEFRKHKIHQKYADIGMVVSEEHRRKGMGTYIIYKLIEYCHIKNVIPIASCESENIASKKTLEKAGMISKHRIVNVRF